MWAVGPGVLLLPSGRMVRGRGLRRAMPEGPDPTFGVYLTGRPSPPTPWPQVWIRWRDFGLPANHAAAVETLRHALELTGVDRVEVACGGGRGRTGTALAVMCVLDGLDPTEATAFVRIGYHQRAVETPWQRRWVRNLEPA